MKQRRFLTVLFTLRLCTFAYPARGIQSAAEYRRQAQEYLAQKNYPRARDAAQTALRLEPRSAEAEDLLGTAELGLGELDTAENHFRRALQIDPGHIGARRNLAAIYLKQKRFTEARGEFEFILKSHPDDFVSLYTLGLVFLLENQPAQALEQFQKAYQVNPGDTTLLIGLLEARLKLKDAGEAAATLAELDARLKARDPRRLQIATLLALEGSYELAIQEFTRLRQVEPDSYEVNYNLALAYHRIGKEVEAVQLLQTLLARRESGELENLLAEVEERRGNIAQALRAYRRAANLDPRNEDYTYDYARALVEQGAFDLALGVFAAATRNFPGSLRMWLGWGAAYYLKGNYEDAAQTLLRAAEIAPDAREVYYLLGRAYEASGPLQDAIARQFARYLSAEPRDPWAHLFYGKILAARGREGSSADLAAAQRFLEKALKLAPDLAEAHLELGNLFEARGDTQEARRELERAAGLDPTSSAVFYRLSQVYRRLGDDARAAQSLRQFHELKAKEGAEKERARVVGFLGRVK